MGRAPRVGRQRLPDVGAKPQNRRAKGRHTLTPERRRLSPSWLDRRPATPILVGNREQLIDIRGKVAVVTGETNMTAGGTGSAGLDGVLTAEQVAGDVVAAMRDEKFLVLPHREVAKYFLSKAQDYERWLGPDAVGGATSRTGPPRR